MAAETTRVIRSRDELIEWAEDEGVLDDSVILAVDASSVTVGLRILEAATDDPRAAFRRTTEQFLPFTLSSDDGSVLVNGELAPNAAFESSLLEDGESFGLALDTGEAEVRALSRAWRIDVGRPVTIAVVPEFNSAVVTFHGAGPLTSTLLRAALTAAGVPVHVFGNWNGSGQSMGAALVRGVEAPTQLPEDDPLSGAWRIVPDGAEATDPRGLWVTGNASQHSAYATVERTHESDPTLVAAVVEALASLPGLSWASSGNRLIEDAAARDAWRRSLPE